jgi:predicted house-cleaning noncanonical NTP pyrophosphatase (MazG superfamily)
LEDHCLKLVEEMNEFKNNKVIEELADIVFVCIAISTRMEGKSLRQALIEKLEVNRNRRWRQLPDDRYRHY